jgi:tetratricopeptide (TPR) repeat protein
MAQDRADLTPTAAIPIESEGLETDVIDVPDSTDSLDVRPSMVSIDGLLALTDEGWDIDDQVRTLKNAAEQKTKSPSIRAAGPKPGSLRLPTPYEIGPIHTSRGIGEARAPGPGRKPTSIPPPLPPGHTSQPPGPAPSGSKLPPPLPSGHTLQAPGAIPPPPPLPRKPPPPVKKSVSESARPAAPGTPAKSSSDPLAGATLVELLSARIAALEEGSDRIGLARAQMELAIAHEMTGEDGRCMSWAEAALKVDPELASAHSMLRRRKHGRGALMAMLGHLDHELATASREAGRVELLVERARLLDAMGERPEVIRSAWTQALAHAPQHPAALKGLENELATRAAQPGAAVELFDAWAAHLGHMADAYASERPLAAWLHVERAQILDKRLGRVDAARGALERALELDPRVGPVRTALVRHVSVRGDAPALVTLLDQEAVIEGDAARAARLELEAATIAWAKLSDPKRAVALLERAADRAPTTPSVDRRVLDDLVRLREASGQWAEASRARRARLRFLTDPAFLAHELRALATTAERIGDLESAISDVQRALSLDATDVTLVENLDRLLSMAGKDDQRVALWLTEAARTDEGAKRARSLVRAATLSEQKLGRTGDAVRHLRTAWTAAPGDPEVLDALTRLLRPTLSEASEAEARTLIELYSQAVETSHDNDRKIAYLEKIALIWEDIVGDPRRAARAYDDILKLEPNKRGAVLGLTRTASRTGDDRTYAKGLLEEARLAQDGVDVLALKTRAATALARHDPARALSLVTEVLGQEPAHAAARALATRLHEEAGRWELAAHSLRARIDHASKEDKLPLLLALAHIEETRLKAPLDALATLQTARTLDPRHPMPPDAIARVLESVGEPTALRNALEALAADATSAEERAYYLVRAAEIDEFRIGDDARAMSLYVKALGETPGDEMIVDRYERALARRPPAPAPAKPRDSTPPPPSGGVSKSNRPPAGIPGDLAQLLAKRLDRTESPVVAREVTFEIASLLVDVGSDIPRATTLLESILAKDPRYTPALRTLETVMRRTAAWAPLARVFEHQADAFRDLRARLGALWALAALEEWRLPVTDPADTYRRILDLDPSDVSALEATVRRELPSALRGDPHARKAAVDALRSLRAQGVDDSAQESADSTRVASLLRLALLLEQLAADAAESQSAAVSREALDLYRRVMDDDPLSVTATTGVARLAGRLNDVAGAARAAMSLAELTADPKVRSRYLIEAAELLLGEGGDSSLGSATERSDRAAGLLERALDADPDSLPAAERLAAQRIEHRQAPRLVETFRTVIRRATASETIVFCGNEIAKVARDEMHDLTLAIDAMRRVREAAPTHVPSLLTLSELCIAQRAWPEAVDALESVATTSRDVSPRLTALFALASIYEKVLSRPVDAERALRSALEVDPANARALRGLLRRLTAKRGHADDGPPPDSAEVCNLLGRLAEVERDPAQRSQLLVQLAELQVNLGDSGAAERALIEAVAQTPGNTKAFARLAAVCREPGAKSPEPVRYARALNTLLGRGTQLGHVDARWLATLGQLEIESLNRVRDGVVHLQRAVQMDPSLYETRFELASAYSMAGAHDDASRTLLGLITPDSQPLLHVADPGSALLLLERTLGAEQRAEDALVASELRALSGELDEGRLAWLRARRLGPLDPHHGQLDTESLKHHVLPPEGRHVLLDVAAAIRGVEAKALRTDLTELGLSTRDRVSARGGNATRALLDRIARTFGVSEVELVITPTVQKTRVIAHDEPWVVVPRALVDAPEPLQVVTLARAVARIALGVPWLEELPPTHVEAYLIAAARIAAPAYASEDIDVLTSRTVGQYEPGLAKALSRKHRRQLEEVGAQLSVLGTTHAQVPPADAFVFALTRAELRAAYVVSGDLLATVDEIRQYDPMLLQATERAGQGSLTAILEHTMAGDVCRFALSPEATALRRRIGSIWT